MPSIMSDPVSDLILEIKLKAKAAEKLADVLDDLRRGDTTEAKKNLKDAVILWFSKIVR